MPSEAEHQSPEGADRLTELITPETIEWIIDAIEQRVIEELERRGLRHNPGVF